MKTFTLDLDAITDHDLAHAVFFGLVATGWTLYTASLLYGDATGTDATTLPDATKVKIAQRAFRNVAEWLPTGSPFRRELDRYIAEMLSDAGNIRSFPK